MLNLQGKAKPKVTIEIRNSSRFLHLSIVEGGGGNNQEEHHIRKREITASDLSDDTANDL